MVTSKILMCAQKVRNFLQFDGEIFSELGLLLLLIEDTSFKLEIP